MKKAVIYFLSLVMAGTLLLVSCGPAEEQTELDEGPLPVIFVPGITGSTLVSAKDSYPLWPPGGPGGDIDYSNLRDDFWRLSLNPATGPHEEIYPTDVIRDYGSEPIYRPFLNFLIEEGGYIEYDTQGNPARRTTRGAFTNQKPKPSLFVFAYDWRLPIEENAHMLSEYVEVVAEYYPEKKVNIVTHSMGGLVARRYIIDHPGKVNKLVTIAAPFLGSAKPLYQMIYGKLSAPAYYGKEATTAGLAEYLTGGPVEDMLAFYPGLHELMASRGYYALGGPPYTVVETLTEAKENMNLPETKEVAFVDLMGPNGIVDQLFPNPNANGSSPAKTNRDFHAYSANGNNQDDWSRDTTGVKYYHLIGVQSTHDTPLSIREAQGYSAAQVRDYALNIYGPGDGTVPRISAERIGNGQNYNAPNAKLYVYDSGPDSLLEHTGIMTNPAVMAQVLNILQETKGWTLAETRINPAGGSLEWVSGSRDETKHKATVSGGSISHFIDETYTIWDNEKGYVDKNYTVSYIFNVNRPETLIPREVATFAASGTGKTSGEPFEGMRVAGIISFLGSTRDGANFGQYLTPTDPSASNDGQTVDLSISGSPPGPISKGIDVSFNVPGSLSGELVVRVKLNALDSTYGSGVLGNDAPVFIEWVYRPSGN